MPIKLFKHRILEITTTEDKNINLTNLTYHFETQLRTQIKKTQLLNAPPHPEHIHTHSHTATTPGFYMVHTFFSSVNRHCQISAESNKPTNYRFYHWIRIGGFIHARGTEIA